MKKIIRCLFLILLVIPFAINASSYSSEVSKANNYLERESFKNTYNKYILYGSSIPYNYENGELKTDTSFNKGGFISKSEFDTTKVKNLSYLFDGTEYWTLTKDGSNVYAITYTDMETAKSPSSNYSGRVTEYVKSTTKVKGSGTYSNPWTFDPMFKVTVKTDNRYATINASENNVYVRGHCNQSDCKASIGVEEKSGYRYITNNCGATYNTETKKIEISDVRRDTVCTVVFGTGNYKITLVGATPNTIYLKYGENYYSDSEGQTIIRKINSITQKRGYTYKGYQYNGYPVIDEDLNIVGGSVDKIYENAVINATYEPIKIPCGSGEYLKKNDISCTTCPAGSYCSGGVYDYSETEDQGIGSCVTGYTSNAGSSTSNQCYINVGAGKYIATVYSSTQTNCAAGYYKEAHTVYYGQVSSCDMCGANTYSTGGSSSCTSCPTGYSSATGSDAKSDCTISCNANYRVNTADAQCTTACSTGYGHAAHNVAAGSTSSACTINSYVLTVNPNGGTWSGSTSNQTFTQNYNTTKTIANPTAGPTYTISYNANSQGATYTASPTSVQRPFSSWSLSGSGSISGTTYTYGAGNGTLTASYSSTSNSFTLPTITKTGHTCKWAEGSTSGTQYNGGASRTITANTTYYAVCTINSYTLTVNPNGGTWNSSTSSQTFTQNYNTTKTIANPTAGPTYTISYNANSQGASYTASPTSVQRAFSSWTKSGSGSISGTTFTFGAGNGTLTANYNTTSNSFTLPTITKSGYACKWAEGSASGTQYAGGTSRTITGNKTYYAKCVSLTLTGSASNEIQTGSCDGSGCYKLLYAKVTSVSCTNKTSTGKTTCKFNTKVRQTGGVNAYANQLSLRIFNGNTKITEISNCEIKPYTNGNPGEWTDSCSVTFNTPTSTVSYTYKGIVNNNGCVKNNVYKNFGWGNCNELSGTLKN